MKVAGIRAFIAAAALAVPAAGFAQPPNLPPHQLVVSAASISDATQTITIAGRNFGSRRGTVLLNLHPVPILTWTDSVIVTGFPAGLTPGSYALAVHAHGLLGLVLRDTISLVIGAAGAKGDKGDPGAKGDTGSPGDPGAPGPRGQSGVNGIREYPTAGDFPFAVPEGVTSLLLEMRGGGGGGAGGFSGLGFGGSGGGGGAYVKTAVSVTPGQTYVIHIGDGGAGGAVDQPGMDADDTYLLAPDGSRHAVTQGGRGGTQGALFTLCPSDPTFFAVAFASAPPGGAGGEAPAAEGIRRAGFPGSKGGGPFGTPSPPPLNSCFSPGLGGLGGPAPSGLPTLSLSSGGAGGAAIGVNQTFPGPVFVIRPAMPGTNGLPGYAIVIW